MTVPTTSAPATASDSEAVAGLHLSVTRERDVEHDLLAIVDALTRHGVQVTWASTHRTVTDAGASCSAAVAAATDPDLLAGYLHVVGRELADSVGPFSTGRSDTSDDDVRAGAAATAFTDRGEGRAVRFPGSDSIGDPTTVGDLLATTAIDEIVVLGSRTVDPATVVETRGFVRPRFVEGRLVLHTQPARGGVLRPFETPSPTPCCADHA